MTSRMKESESGEGRDRSLWKTDMWSGQVMGCHEGQSECNSSIGKGDVGVVG